MDIKKEAQAIEDGTAEYRRIYEMMYTNGCDVHKYGSLIGLARNNADNATKFDKIGRYEDAVRCITAAQHAYTQLTAITLKLNCTMGTHTCKNCNKDATHAGYIRYCTDCIEKVI